jgi:hypothetical protein
VASGRIAWTIPIAGRALPGPKETTMGKGDHRQRKEVKKPKKNKAAKGKK